MALITCHECSNEISNEALTCPNCGCRTAYAKKVNERIVKSNQNIFIGTFCVIGAIMLIIIGSILISIATEPKPDYDRFLRAMSYVVEKNDYIEEVIINKRNSIDVIVSNAWWNSSNEAKNKFAKNIYETTYLYALDNKLIHKKSSLLFVYIYDQDGIKVAKADSFSIDILK